LFAIGENLPTGEMLNRLAVAIHLILEYFFCSMRVGMLARRLLCKRQSGLGRVSTRRRSHLAFRQSSPRAYSGDKLSVEGTMQPIRAGNPFAIKLAFAMLVVVLTFIALLNAQVIATHGNVSPINLTEGVPLFVEH
jgi:hypothetical protein